MVKTVEPLIKVYLYWDSQRNLHATVEPISSRRQRIKRSLVKVLKLVFFLFSIKRSPLYCGRDHPLLSLNGHFLLSSICIKRSLKASPHK